jgi:phage FluMu gp28-like protein
MLTAQEFVRDYMAKWAKAANIAARGLGAESGDVVDELNGVRAFQVLFNNGSRVVSLSSTPEAFAGKGGDVLVDEADLHKDSRKVLDMAQPCVMWGGQLEVVSALSVDGGPDSAFHRLVEEARTGGNPRGWSLHRTTILDAVAEGLVERLSEVTGRGWERGEWLEWMRASHSPDAWRTQFLLEPSEGAAALLGHELLDACGFRGAAPEAAGGAPLYVGMDIGRHRDLTVVWSLRLVGDVLWTEAVRVLERTPFRDQLEVLSGVLSDRRLARCCVDATGIGAMLAEEARRLHGSYRVEPVVFTAPAKEEMAVGLRRLFEDRRVRVPDSPEVRADLRKVRKTTTAAGNVRYEAERDGDGHADRFWALALAAHAASTAAGPCEFYAGGAVRAGGGDGFWTPRGDAEAGGPLARALGGGSDGWRARV